MAIEPDVGPYRASGRTLRQSRGWLAQAKWFAVIGLAVAGGRLLVSGLSLSGLPGLWWTLASGVLGVVLGMVLLRGLRLRLRNRMSARMVDGVLLAARCAVTMTTEDRLQDLNHQSEAGDGRIAYGTILVTPEHFMIEIDDTKHHKPGVVLETAWGDVRSAELVPDRRNRLTTVTLETSIGERQQLGVLVPAQRLAALLPSVGVKPPVSEPPWDGRLRNQDTVALPTGGTGTVVGVLPRPDEMGHATIFVKLDTGSVESWDSSAIRKL
jgi:hypothetical protein